MATQITIWYNDGEMIDDADCTGYDFDASMASFEELLAAEIVGEYLNADVTIIRNRAVVGACKSPEIDGQSGGAAGSVVDSIIERVYFREDWMVKAQRA